MADHAHAHSHGNKVHVDRKLYVKIFFALLILTIIEVGVAYLPISTPLMVSALVGLAIVKATLVALFYMHLSHETKVLKLTVLIPLSLPVFYAVVLIADAAWRMLRW